MRTRARIKTKAEVHGRSGLRLTSAGMFSDSIMSGKDGNLTSLCTISRLNASSGEIFLHKFINFRLKYSPPYNLVFYFSFSSTKQTHLIRIKIKKKLQGQK